MKLRRSIYINLYSVINTLFLDTFHGENTDKLIICHKKYIFMPKNIVILCYEDIGKCTCLPFPIVILAN